MQITYADYFDRILGGWLGKCIGGTIGARFEGEKQWIEMTPDQLFPEKVPPNDDLDLQVLWLKVLEERGPAFTSDDLARAWLEGCWYPFNEYGIFRRNYRLGIAPPVSGRYGNAFWETGMGCPIRSEIWGYVFPGAPDLAAEFAQRDGTLDHTEESVGAERMFSAMAALAFFVPDVRRLTQMCIHYLPRGSVVERLVREAFVCYDAGLPLAEARERLLALGGHPEGCDAQNSVPITFLGLLYGGNDLEKALIAALNCGYDTDCTLATAGALLGQILGARRIPEHLKKPIGDALVMGIQYRRPEMTVSALARDTARMGVLMAQALQTAVAITDAPRMEPLPATAQAPATRLSIQYAEEPGTIPGQSRRVTVGISGVIPAGGELSIECPPGWTAQPPRAKVDPENRCVDVTLHPDPQVAHWPMSNLFQARLGNSAARRFGIMGEPLWMFLGVYFDPKRDPQASWEQPRNQMNHHYVDLARAYLPEPAVDIEAQYQRWSRILGRPAMVPAVGGTEIDVRRLIGLRGEYCVYLARRVLVSQARQAAVVIGNNDAFRVYVNGELAKESNSVAMWTPHNHVQSITLRQGENLLLVKLVKRTDHLRFTLGLRDNTEGRWWGLDWLTDLVDVNPLAW